MIAYDMSSVRDSVVVVACGMIAYDEIGEEARRSLRDDYL
jgi:hypothetical protein